MGISFIGFVMEDNEVAPTQISIPWFTDRPIIM